MVKLNDVKDTAKGATVLVGCRIPTEYKEFLTENKIGLRELVIASIDELKAQKTKKRT